MSSRAGNCSAEQRTLLIEFVKKNPKLVEGKFTKNFTYKDGQKLWAEITQILNSVPNGGSKNWKQWRKVWQDIRTKSKNKRAKNIRSRAQTGGGVANEEELDNLDIEVLNIVSKTAVEGLQNIEETIVPLFPESSGINSPPPTTTTVREQRTVIAAQTILQPKTPSLKQQRMQATLSAADRMANSCEKKIDKKEKYYEKKLALMEKDVEVKKEIADSLKTLIELFSKK